VPYLNAGFWAVHFRESFAHQVELLENSTLARALAAFDGLDQEAEAVAEAEYRRLGSTPGEGDMADAAEQAQEVGLEHYLQLTGIRQGLLNMLAASVHHLFEQQLMMFYRRQVLTSAEERDPKVGGAASRIPAVLEALSKYGVNVKQLPSWPVVEELGLIAHTVKHGDGPSARKLHERRPELFMAPSLRQLGDKAPAWARPRHPHAITPILGNGLHVSEADIRHYGLALRSFWFELANEIERAETETQGS
jgi:hypothetical protein